DADGERHYRNDGEPRRLGDRSRCVTDVLSEALPPAPAPDIGTRDFDRRAVAEFAPRGEAGRLGREAALAKLLRTQLLVQTHFLIQLGRSLGPMKEISQPPWKIAQCHSTLLRWEQHASDRPGHAAVCRKLGREALLPRRGELVVARTPVLRGLAP